MRNRRVRIVEAAAKGVAPEGFPRYPPDSANAPPLTEPPKPPAKTGVSAIEVLRAGPVLGVGFSVDHLVCCVLDALERPVGTRRRPGGDSGLPAARQGR